MRHTAPIAFVPELNATLFTKRDDIFINEKKVNVFSSRQPDGLMTKLMGENMMRKDGKDHLRERRIISPSVSPKTVKNTWLSLFNGHADRLLDEIKPLKSSDLIEKFAKPLSGEALKLVTGLTNMSYEEMDRVSQGMIDGCSNYTGDLTVEENCNNCTESIDAHIDEMIPVLRQSPNTSILSMQLESGLSDEQIRANVKLAISGGQNEPRDAIAGAIWALLTHNTELKGVFNKEYSWLQAFEEFARWISPIGMSPREIAEPYSYKGVDFEVGERIFFMFNSANRDEEIFDDSDKFILKRDLSRSVTFGAGPHYCAGAWISRALIADVALPKIFRRLKGLQLINPKNVLFDGWAFRGPLSLECQWN
jgi:cytochrome P450